MNGTITPWVSNLLRAVDTVHELNRLPSLDAPFVKAALAGEAAVLNQAAQRAQSEFDIARAFRRAR